MDGVRAAERGEAIAPRGAVVSRGRRGAAGRIGLSGLLLGFALVGAALANSAWATSPCTEGPTTNPAGTVVSGTPCADRIVATSPQVREIRGGGGDDVIYANPNVEAIDAGPGDDVVHGELPETATGDKGPAERRGATTSGLRRRHRHRLARRTHRTTTATASAVVYCEEMDCPGTSESDTIYGGDGRQEIHGKAGNDLVYAERGNDEIWGEGGDDELYGGTGDDEIHGGNDDDFVAGGPGFDRVSGNAHNDLIRGDGTIDRIWGRDGTDTLSFATAVTPGFTDGYPSEIPQVKGFPEDEAGDGRGVFVRLDGGTTNCGLPSCNNSAGLGGGNDELITEVENVIGSPFADVIVGTSGANRIYGGGGGDVIVGAGDADQLFGGAEGDYLEGSGAAAAYGGVGTDNCVGVGSSSECEGTEARVAQHESGTMSAGFMTASPIAGHASLYLVGSEYGDAVTASISGSTVTFTSYGSSRFGGGEPVGCVYRQEGTKAECALPEGTTSLDAVTMAGLGAVDQLSVAGGGFQLSTAISLLGGEGGDILEGDNATEDVLVDGPGEGDDTLKGYGHDEWLLNNEGQDTLEGGYGNDLIVSTTTCDGDVLNGAYEGEGDGEAINNASWAQLRTGGVGASLELSKAGESWSNGEPTCAAGAAWRATLVHIDVLEGSNGGDVLVGDSSQNGLLGRKGEDYLGGKAGYDTLIGWENETSDTLNGGGGEEEDECRVERQLDTWSNCLKVVPPLIPTTTNATVQQTLYGQPGYVTVTGHVYADDGSALSGKSVNVNFSRWDGDQWVFKHAAHPTISNNYYAVNNWGVSAGQWRVRTVFPEQGAYERSNSSFQEFTIKKGYRFIMRHSGKCLTVYGNSDSDGAAIVQWTCSSSPSPNDGQVFTLVPMGGGYYEVKANSSGKCFDVTGASTADGAKIQQWSCHGGSNQQWDVVPIEDQPPWQAFMVKHSGKCLDVYAASESDGAKVVQWTCKWPANQQWKWEGIG